MWTPADRSLTDMRLIWHYTNSTYTSLSSWTGPEQPVANLLRGRLLEHALNTPFLLDGILGLTAMHMNFLGRTDISPSVATMYRTRAMSGYRAAIARADPASFPALLISSIIVCGLSSVEFRGPNPKPLFILDWLTLWRGIGLIVELTRLRTLTSSGLAILFYRPPLDLSETPTYLPSSLLFLISSIPPTDPDHPHQSTYYNFLKYLGALYAELSTCGFGPLLNLRIITFLSFSTEEFIALARERRHRAAIIIAHYLVFVKLVKILWWMSDISDVEIKNITDLVGEGELKEFMRVPREALGVEDPLALARLLLGNPGWEQPTRREVKWPLEEFVDQNGKPVTGWELGTKEKGNEGVAEEVEEDGETGSEGGVDATLVGML